MEKTVRKMTGATADRFALKDRGYLKPGCYADVTVFDEVALKSAQPDQPHSFGICKVLINGKPVLDGEKADYNALKSAGMAIPVTE